MSRYDQIPKRIARYNRGRDPARLAMKYAAMRRDAFVFLRGTCHLFYDGVAEEGVLRKAPRTWCCGDLHIENFGSYKGDNRLVYFDLNDFDEAALATATWDLLRLATSIFVAAGALKVAEKDARALAACLIDAYCLRLADGSARWVERETATGLVRELMDALESRQRKAFLDRRTAVRRGQRRFILDGQHLLAATKDEVRRVEAMLAAFAAKQPDPRFFRVLDVARRVAGTGSLGVARFAILVHGKGSPDRNYILDLKQSLPSSLLPCLAIRQPEWPSQSHRIVGVQRRMQAVPMAFLAPVDLDGTAHVLRALQPVEDRVALTPGRVRMDRARDLAATMGHLLASAQLRSGGRQGAAVADELIEFGQATKWRARLLALALEQCSQVQSQWKAYAAAYDDGFFAPEGAAGRPDRSAKAFRR